MSAGRRPGCARRPPGVQAAGLGAAWVAVAACVPWPVPGEAQGFPARPVRWIVPYAPGGNTDMVSRVVAARMGEGLGQPVVVENRPGAATLIGAEHVARSAPDGHTVLLATSTTLAINPHLYRKLPYDPVHDFAPIVLVSQSPMVLAVHPSLPVKSLKELVAIARKRPGELAYGSSGTGSPSYMSMEMLKAAAKIDLVEVPYKGSGPADTDLLGGQISMMFQNTALVHVRAGRLRAIVHTGNKPMPVYPGVPTVAASGFPDVVFFSWLSVVAPAGTPAEVVGRLNAEITRAARHPDAQSRITADGAELLGGTPAELGAYIRSEIERFGKVIRAAGVKPQ